MAMPGVDFKWYDGFFLSMLATSIIIVSIKWKRYHLCVHPLHIWIVLPEQGQKWGFLIWLAFSYCGLMCLAFMSIGKVLVDMIRVPGWAFEAGGQELRGMSQDTTYHPGLYLTAAQRETVEALIQELPKFRLKAVPTDCSEGPICLDEFHLGSEVRGLPCAHNFHVQCIDQWLRLNVRCPRCRCSVFPNLDLSALSNLRSESERPSASEEMTAATRFVRSSQPAGQSYLLRLQGLLLGTEATVGGGSAVDHGAGMDSLVHPVTVSEGTENITEDHNLLHVLVDQRSPT